MVDFGLAGGDADLLIVGLDRLRSPVQNLLNGSQGDGKPQHGGAEILNGEPAVAMGASQLGDRPH